MLSRRIIVFLFNVDRLVKRRRTYLWTFTLPEVREYAELRKDWNRCLTYLRRKLPDWSGIRVYEVHPGKWNLWSHGLHVHVVCNKFFDVTLVREVAKASGFGRVHVVIRKNSMGYYLAKYLTKKRPESLRGWRLWAPFNMPDRTRMADVVLDTLRSRLFRFGHASTTFATLGWAERLATVAHWEWQRIAGERLTMPIRPFGWNYAGTQRRARKCRTEPDRYNTVALPWSFSPRQVAPEPARFNPYRSATGGADDMLLSDIRRNTVFERALKAELQPF